jgi:hypothetical protein
MYIIYCSRHKIIAVEIITPITPVTGMAFSLQICSPKQVSKHVVATLLHFRYFASLFVHS